jgi:hypothetical protein
MATTAGAGVAGSLKTRLRVRAVHSVTAGGIAEDA